MESYVVLDLDDFCEENNQLNYLEALKTEIPQIKINLFTIPGRCSYNFLKWAWNQDWFDLIPHGFWHNTSRECENWTYQYSLEYLVQMEDMGFTRGFKAPGWQISDGMYRALKNQNWWVADQIYNRERRPLGLRVYELDSPNKIHGHIGHMGSHNPNEVGIIYNQIVEQTHNKEFKFIKEIV